MPPTASGPFSLQRFVEAQERVYDAVCNELRSGQKESHWIWFIFPQVAGLGRSNTAQRFAIVSIDEAAAYLAHPILGLRLRECTRLILKIEGRTAEEIFGCPDWMKFRSSMTLFARTADDDSLFVAALETFFEGENDDATLRLLGSL
jgi:uncharacterized protein (DUF1810 family)